MPTATRTPAPGPGASPGHQSTPRPAPPSGQQARPRAGTPSGAGGPGRGSTQPAARHPSQASGRPASPQPAPKARPKTDGKTGPQPARKTGPQPARKTGAQPGPRTGPKTDGKTGPQPARKTGAQPGPRTAPEAGPNRGPAARTGSAQRTAQRRISPRAAALRARRLFYRWLWFVYVPIGVSVLVLLVAMTGLLPHQATLPLLALLAWDAGGIFLILERRRRGISVPVPRTLVVGVVSLTVLVLLGTLLAWMGVDRLASSGGPQLLVIGSFLLLLAMFAPVLRMIDATMRFAGRRAVRLRHPPARTNRQGRKAA